MIRALDCYRELADAARRAGHAVEIGAAAGGAPLIVTVAPVRFALVIADRPASSWIVPRPGEPLGNYAARVHAKLDPLTTRWLALGLVPIVVNPTEASTDLGADLVLARLRWLQVCFICVAQGSLDEALAFAQDLVAPARAP